MQVPLYHKLQLASSDTARGSYKAFLVAKQGFNEDSSISN